MSHGPICPCCAPARAGSGGIVVVMIGGAVLYANRAAIAHAIQTAVVVALVVLGTVAVVTGATVGARAYRDRRLYGPPPSRAEQRAIQEDVVRRSAAARAALGQAPRAIEPPAPVVRAVAERLPVGERVR